jgi:hypothetical protein
MLKIPAEYDTDTSPAKWPFLANFLPASLVGDLPGICQKALVDESGIMITQIGTQNRSENGRGTWDA